MKEIPKVFNNYEIVDKRRLGMLPVKTCQNNWIPVSECVPLYSAKVLIVTPSGYATHAKFDGGNRCFRIRMTSNSTARINAKAWRLYPETPDRPTPPEVRMRVYITNDWVLSIDEDNNNEESIRQ